MNHYYKNKEHTNCHSKSKRDYFLYVIIYFGLIFYLGHLLNFQVILFSVSFDHFFHSFFNIMNKMSFGVLLGIIFVGILGEIPREYVISIIGKPGTFTGILRATGAGLLLDLCSHGILLVGMKLYERGASTAQVMAFLIANPWNSLSLTIILFALIGVKWTIIFIILSVIVALTSAAIFDILEKKNLLPANPNKVDIPVDFYFFQNLKSDFSQYQYSFKS